MQFYVEPAVFRPYIDRAKRLPLADRIIESLGKPLTMSVGMFSTRCVLIKRANTQKNITAETRSIMHARVEKNLRGL